MATSMPKYGHQDQQENTMSESMNPGLMTATAGSSSSSNPIPQNDDDHDDDHRKQKSQPQHPSLLRGTTAPSRFRPSDESVFQSWIQQSLVSPSASNGTNLPTVAGGRRMEDAFVDASLPPSSSTPLSGNTNHHQHHRKQRSLGSNWLGSNGDASLSSIAASAGFLGSGPPPPPPSFFRNSDHAVSTVSSAAAATIAASTTTTNSHNVKSNASRSHPFSNPDFELSWSIHSNSFGAGTDNESSSNGLTMAGGGAGDPSASSASLLGDRPLVVGRVPSTCPYRDDDIVGIPSDIHDAARITNWTTVVELCKTQPEAAAYTGRDGWTALHHACNRRCPFPDVVEELIRAYPDALLVEEEKGWLPIHLACRFKAPKDVVRLLLYMYPDKGRLGVSRPDRRGRCPLYYAVRYDAPPGVVSLLLEVGPSAVLEEDQNAESPLALIWNSWAKKTENQQILQKIVGVVDENAPLVERADQVGKRLKARPKILDRWNKVNSFLKAAFGFELDDDWEFVGDSPSEEKKDSPSRDERSTPRERKWRILHAVSSIKCHHSLFKLACALHPEQAEELDQNDLRRIDDKQSIIPPSKCIPQRLRGPTNVSSLHLACSSGANGDAGKHVIVQLLAMYPAASQFTDSEGSTSLHRIAENVHKASWTQDGAEEIYIAHPEAVRVADVNGQFPLHRAAKAISYAWGGISEDEIRERSKICRLLQANEEASHQADHMGCLPLHYVAEYGVSWDLQVQALYDANTAAVQTRAGVKCYNRLPIHMAAANPKADFTLISKLVELNPRATGQSDRMGKLPLHLACEAGHCWETIECILNAHDGAVEEREENQRGWKALHIAAYSHRADGEVLSNLTRLHPEAAGISDRQGRFPLHLACLSDKAWHDGLSDLFDSYPEAIRTPDAMGLLPLHIMSFRYSPKPDNENEETPKVIDLQSRNPSRSVGTEPTQPTKEELRDATEIANLFNLIKADPTVLDGIY